VEEKGNFTGLLWCAVLCEPGFKVLVYRAKTWSLVRGGTWPRAPRSSQTSGSDQTQCDVWGHAFPTLSTVPLRTWPLSGPCWGAADTARQCEWVPSVASLGAAKPSLPPPSDWDAQLKAGTPHSDSSLGLGSKAFPGWCWWNQPMAFSLYSHGF
jgi:hypothetical protein